MDIQDYQTELVKYMSDAWSLAQQNIATAQSKQKRNYDVGSSDVSLKVGDGVMVEMPGEIRGNAWKLSRPFHGPYRVLSITPTNVEVRLADQPDADPMNVSLKRVRPCFDELPDKSWTGHKSSKGTKKQAKVVINKPENPKAPYTGPVTRSRSKSQV